MLTMRDVLAIVETLVAWKATNSRAEVDELLRLSGVPLAAAAERPWYAELPEHVTGRSAPAPATLVELPSLTEPPRSPRHRPTSLPHPITRFIGRVAEVAAATAAVRENRLVTLTGMGGIGKTRLALEVAAALEPEFADGVAFTDLTPVTDPALIGVALLRALRLPRSSQPVETQLVEALAEARLLLVVDNVEQVVDGSSMLGRLLTGAAGLHVLATSRVLLRLYGEYEFHVPPLSLPVDTAETAAGIRDSDAVQLFLHRARSVSSGLEPQGAALTAVAEICTALDGLPLALELAAAQARIWSVQSILDRLSDRLDLLADGVRDRPSRHQSLRATLEWSYGLLTPDERDVLARVGVFVGAFDTAAAAAVTSRDHASVVELLTRLTTHSLLEISYADPGRGPVRFRMLQSVRDYAVALLQTRGDLEATRRAHLDHYTSLAAGADPRGLGTHLDQIQADIDDVDAALSWVCAAVEPDPSTLTAGMQLAISTVRFWNRRIAVPEVRTYLDRLLDADTRLGAVPPAVRADATIRAASLATSNGNYDRAVALAEESLRLFIELSDASGMSWAHQQLGEVALAADDLKRAGAHFVTQIELAQGAGDLPAEADGYNMLGQTTARLGHYAEAEDQLRRAVAVFRRLGNTDQCGNVLDSLAELAFRRWDISEAAAYWREAIALHWRTENRRALTYHIEGCAKIMAVNDQPAAAARYLGAAQQLRQLGGWVLPEPERLSLEGVLAESSGALPASAREQALDGGRRQELADIVASALNDLDALAPSSAGFG